MSFVGIAFATIDRGTNTAIGSTSFHHYRAHDGMVEIGSTWLDPRAWGTGANIEAKLLMLEHAFEIVGCVRVEFKTDARNTRSRAAFAALPAQFEGILRKQIRLPGIGVRDSAFFQRDRRRVAHGTGKPPLTHYPAPRALKNPTVLIRPIS